MLANAQIAGVGEIAGQPTVEQRETLGEALRVLEHVLEVWPTSVDARHAAVVALFGRGEAGGTACQGHLRWLLAHGSPQDARRRTWEALRAH